MGYDEEFMIHENYRSSRAEHYYLIIYHNVIITGDHVIFHNKSNNCISATSRDLNIFYIKYKYDIVFYFYYIFTYSNSHNTRLP